MRKPWSAKVPPVSKKCCSLHDSVHLSPHNVVFPAGFQKMAVGNVRKAAVSPDTTYLSSGWIASTYYDDGDCGSPYFTEGFAVNTCFVENGLGYKYQVVGGNLVKTLHTPRPHHVSILCSLKPNRSFSQTRALAPFARTSLTRTAPPWTPKPYQKAIHLASHLGASAVASTAHPPPPPRFRTQTSRSRKYTTTT